MLGLARVQEPAHKPYPNHVPLEIGVDEIGAKSVQNQTKLADMDFHSTSTIRSLVEAEFGLKSEMLKVAFCESRFRHFSDDGSILYSHYGTMDVGIFQINEDYHGGRADELKIDLHDPLGNIAFAILLYSEQGLDPWEASRPCWQYYIPELGF